MNDTPAEREAESTWARLRRRKVVQWGVAYPAGAWLLMQVLESLAEIDRRAGRTIDARERAAGAASLAPFATPRFAGLSPTEIYRAGRFYEQPRRLAALRDLVRPLGPR